MAVSWRRGSLLMPSRKNKPPPDFLLSHKQHTLLNSPPFFPSLCFLLSLLTLGIDHFLFTKRDRRGGRWIALDCVGLRSIALDCVGGEWKRLVSSLVIMQIVVGLRGGLGFTDLQLLLREASRFNLRRVALPVGRVLLRLGNDLGSLVLVGLGRSGGGPRGR